MDLTPLILLANTFRQGELSLREAAVEAEGQLEERFATSTRLAVYGSLRPGQPNHHIVAPLGGRWEHGVVEADLVRGGWGAGMGFPAIEPRPGGQVVPVEVLTSTALPDDWPRLDEFEGDEYCRVLVPVWNTGDHANRNLLTVANLYAISRRKPHSRQT